jgi:hypothetical protein
LWFVGRRPRCHDPDRRTGACRRHRATRAFDRPPPWASPLPGTSPRRGGKLGGVLVLATDWSTISSLATGVGTLVLAIATFASVRSSSRSARIAEAALRDQRRPVLAPSRPDDPVQKMVFVGGHWASAAGGRAVAEHVDGSIYLAISLRNVGAGIAVCQGWVGRAGLASSRTTSSHAPEEEFRPQLRDLYIPAGDIGMWLGSVRAAGDRVLGSIAEAIDTREPMTIELVYSDLVGRQRTITRFGIVPADQGSWLAVMTRNWYLEWDGPRPDTDAPAATPIEDEQETADSRAAEPGSVPGDNAHGHVSHG